MSNSSLKQRIESKADALSDSPIALEEFSKFLDMSVDALERLSYPMRQIGKSIALDFLHKSWAAEEELEASVEYELDSLKKWLREVPD